MVKDSSVPATSVTKAQLLELYRKLEVQLIEQAAQIERVRLDVVNLTARVTVRPPPPAKRLT